MRPKKLLSLRQVFVLGLCAAATAGWTTRANCQVIYQDSFDAASQSNWIEAGTFDVEFDFGYDYSIDDVPPAPNGSDTIGLRTAVNVFDGEVSELALVYEDVALTGQFTVQVDVWNNWFLDEISNPNFSGTTEYTGAGVGHDGFVLGRDGALMVYDGDGDSSSDYRLYKNSTLQDPASEQYKIGEHFENDAQGNPIRRDNNNSNPVLQEAFPGFDVNDVVPDQVLQGTIRDGAGGFQWMTLTVEVDNEAIGMGTTQDPGVATFTLTSASSGNTVTIGSIDNSNGGDVVNMQGSAVLYMLDVFTSVSPSPAHSFGLFDNLVITEGITPPPAGLDGDYNNNNAVEQGDLDLVLLHWGESADPPPGNWTNDLPQGNIDQNELDRLLLNWGNTAGQLGAAHGVPEPSSFLLMLVVGLLSLLVRKRG